ncbi:DsbC family protein [Ectothiorhodospiraceae bacterium BW-2]|nr:DsbC family protein [Ectothiorhodospiraceae bacterium BW-2]
MKYRLFSGLAVVAVAITAVVALASASAEPDPAAAASANEKITQQLARMIPGKPDAISATEMPGLYEVRFGTRLFYASEDGRYLFDGELYDLANGVNLTEAAGQSLRKELLAGLDADRLLTYPAKEEKYVVSIFTDIDCPYCRKLHDHMAEMNEMGVTVHYLLFPRAGVGSDSYKKAVSVWCATDRNLAMDRAKGGIEVESKQCENPVQEHIALVRDFGVTGTPAIVLESGKLVPGYLPPKRLLALLEAE